MRPVQSSDARVEERGHRVHHARAADALRRRVPERVHAQVAVGEPDAVDGAERRAHAAAQLGALECGAGGRGAGPEVVARAQQHLAVGADVHRDPPLRRLADAGGQRHRYRVGAHEAGHDGEEADARLRIHLEEELARGELERMSQHGRVGRKPHMRRIDAEEEMVHAGIAHHHHLVDPLREHARLGAELLHVLVEEAHDAGVELAEIAGIELGEGDARHEVGAEHRLGIEARHRGQLLAGLELHQRRHDAGGADVHREPELHERGVARVHGEDAASPGGDGDLARVLAQRLGQGADDFGGDVLLAPPDGAEQLLEVGGLVVLLLGQLHVDQLLADARVDGHALQRRRRRLRAEDLEAPLVERGRHLHRDRLEHAALTREAIALAHEGVAELELVHHGGRRHGAGGELHPAGGAAPAPAAGGGDVHPGRVRGAEDGGARLDLEGSRVGQHGETHGGHADRG